MDEIDFSAAHPPGMVVATVPETPTIFTVIERAARDPAVDIDKLERLLQMQERLQAKQAQVEFDNAMADAQEQMQQVRKDSYNLQTKSRYASYAALDAAMRPVYSRHGFALSFDTEAAADSYVRVVCCVAHRGGHRQRHQIDMPADGKGAKGADVMTKTHATGSAVQYGKRYLLGMIFNVALSDRPDDDGNAAGRRDYDGPGSSWGPGGKDAAIDDARRDGLMDNAPKVTQARLQQLAKWIKRMEGTLQLSGQTPDSIKALWDEPKDLKNHEDAAEHLPDEYAALTALARKCRQVASERMRAVQEPVPNTLMAG